MRSYKLRRLSGRPKAACRGTSSYRAFHASSVECNSALVRDPSGDRRIDGFLWGSIQSCEADARQAGQSAPLIQLPFPAPPPLRRLRSGWTCLFCALLFWLHLRKKGRRPPAPRAQGTRSRQNWLKSTQLACTVLTQPKIGMLCAMKTM